MIDRIIRNVDLVVFLSYVCFNLFICLWMTMYEDYRHPNSDQNTAVTKSFIDSLKAGLFFLVFYILFCMIVLSVTIYGRMAKLCNKILGLD